MNYLAQEQFNVLKNDYIQIFDSAIEKINSEKFRYECASTAIKTGKFVIYASQFILRFAPVALLDVTVKKAIGFSLIWECPIPYGTTFLSVFTFLPISLSASERAQEILEKFNYDKLKETFKFKIDFLKELGNALYQARLRAENLDFQECVMKLIEIYQKSQQDPLGISNLVFKDLAQIDINKEACLGKSLIPKAVYKEHEKNHIKAIMTKLNPFFQPHFEKLYNDFIYFYNQNQNYNPNQGYNQNLSYNPNQGYNQNLSYNPNQGYNQNLSYNPDQGYNQNPSYNSNQGYNQNPSYNPNQGYNQNPSYNPNQVYNQNLSYNPNQGYNQNPSYNPNQVYNQNLSYNQNQGYYNQNYYNENQISGGMRNTY